MNNQQTDTPKATILIVDDTPHVQRLLSAMLLKQGYDVQTADSGQKALEVVRATPPNLILLDIMMPHMDGFEVCAHLKADEQTRDIPILFVSALEEVENKVKAFTAGGVDYITKPFQAKEVLARVATHLALRALQEQLEEASEELAAQLKELQARNEELDTLARSMGHDLKTPLTSIIGFADMLKSLHTTLPGESLEESLDAIASNGRKMDKIIDELLLLAGLREVKQVDIQPLNMATLVNMALKRIKDQIEEYEADIIVPDEWPAALGHGPWVEEIWANYVSSAIESGGRPPRVELGATLEEDGAIRFWVRDNSPGAAFSEQPQSLSSSGQRAPDRGLGMIVARRIMEKLGRKASVESTEDEGNIYSFTLRAV